jgi:hypothetical protein
VQRQHGAEGFLQAGHGGHHHRAVEEHHRPRPVSGAVRRGEGPVDTDHVHGERHGNQHLQDHINLVRGAVHRWKVLVPADSRRDHVPTLMILPGRAQCYSTMRLTYDD